MVEATRIECLALVGCNLAQLSVNDVSKVFFRHWPLKSPVCQNKVSWQVAVSNIQRSSTSELQALLQKELINPCDDHPISSREKQMDTFQHMIETSGKLT